MGIGLGMGLGTMRSAGNMFGSIADSINNGGGSQGADGEEAGGMKCLKCSSLIRKGMKFCGNCGEKVESGLVCPQCGYENSDGMRFCGNCGYKLIKQCAACGAENDVMQKFCGNCGNRL